MGGGGWEGLREREEYEERWGGWERWGGRKSISVGGKMGRNRGKRRLPRSVGRERRVGGGGLSDKEL